MSDIKKNTHEKKGKFEKFLTGRGYYAVIAVAVLAVGVSAFAATRDGIAERNEVRQEQGDLVDYRNSGERDQQVTAPKTDVKETQKTEEETNEADAKTDEKSDNTVKTDGEKQDSSTNADKETKTEEADSKESGASVVTTPQELKAPVAGKVINPHSNGASVYSETMKDYRQHDGVDLAAAVGDPVIAAADGTVDGLYFDDLWGQVVVLTHTGGVKTIYKNLSSEVAEGLRPGAKVKQGDTIGKIGNEGIIESVGDAHLHFEVEKNGKNVDPTTVISFTN